MTYPKISVITVSFNQGRFIKDTIESVLAQNYPNFEHIVMDGGSTDETLDILRSYPHLIWRSENDRGQTHALNKAFALATGEIIAWINSDDVYLPGAFHAIAPHFKTHDVVIGNAEETDLFLNPVNMVKNTPREYADILRYWVPGSWLAQPAIFFKKKLLDEVAYGKNEYLDESLFFVMDTDLWVRLAKKTPFTCYLDATLSKFRMYETNKTGEFPLATQRELSRVFRRQERSNSINEYPMTVSVVVNDDLESLALTIQDLQKQDLLDFEVLVVGTMSDRKIRKELQKKVFNFDDERKISKIRLVYSDAPGFISGCNAALKLSTSSNVALLNAGDRVREEFVKWCLNLLRNDHVGVLYLPDQVNRLKTDGLFEPESKALRFDAFLNMRDLEPRLVVRRVVLSDVEPFRFQKNPHAAFFDFISRVNSKAWLIYMDTPFDIQYGRLVSCKNDSLDTLLMALIIKALSDIQKMDLYFEHRARANWAAAVPDSLVLEAQKVIAQAAPEQLAFFG